MSAIIFHWVISKNANPDSVNAHMRKRLLSRWSLMVKAFLREKPKLYLVTNDPDAKIGDSEVIFKSFTSLNDALEHSKKDGKPIFIEQGGASLQKFNHPEKAVYVFGSDYGNLDKYDNKVSIESNLPVHSEIAAGIVLAHRFLQWH